MAPRYPMADRAKAAPAERPSRVGSQPGFDAASRARGFIVITMTPAVAIAMADAIIGVTASPRNRRPNTATWTGSVLIYAIATTKERSPIAASMRAVAAICVRA